MLKVYISFIRNEQSRTSYSKISALFTFDTDRNTGKIFEEI